MRAIYQSKIGLGLMDKGTFKFVLKTENNLSRKVLKMYFVLYKRPGMHPLIA